MRSFTEIVMYCLFGGSIDVFLPDHFSNTSGMLLFIPFATTRCGILFALCTICSSLIGIRSTRFLATGIVSLCPMWILLL